jgi:hypothetical protein
MSRFIPLPFGPEAKKPVDADSISSVFMSFPERRPAETRISMHNKPTRTITSDQATPNQILTFLQDQNVALVRQPGVFTTHQNQRYVAPRWVNFVQTTLPGDADQQIMVVGVRGPGNNKTVRVATADTQDFVAALQKQNKDLRPFDMTGSGFLPDSNIHVVPATIAFMEEERGSLDVFCLDTRPFAVIPTPADGKTGILKDGIRSAALEFSRMNGSMIELPSDPVVHVSTRRVLWPAFTNAVQAGGTITADLNLRPGTDGRGRETHSVIFRTPQDLDGATHAVKERHQTPSSMLPPALEPPASGSSPPPAPRLA